MSDERLNTIDPKVAERWVSEIERKKADNRSTAARGRQELNKLFDLAEGAGLKRDRLKRTLERREFEAKQAAKDAVLTEDELQEIELLNEALGNLPLGAWAVGQMRASPRKSAAIPGDVPDPDQMTLAEAKAVLAEPKKRGRQSDAAKTRRAAAERVVAEADHQVSVDAGLADEAPDALSSLTDGEDEQDLRPAFLRAGYDVETPPEAA